MADTLTRCFVFVTALCVVASACDRFARRNGLYLDTVVDWPESVIVRRRGVRADAPYRASQAVDRAVLPGGIPAAASVMLLPVALLSLAWSLCIVFALGDLPAAFAGHRALGRALASLGWCALRAAVGWSALSAVVTNRPRVFGVLGVLALALDVALATTDVPCSDIRADDIRVAKVGLVVHGLLTAGYAWSQWRRRGAVDAAVQRAMS